VSLEQGVLSIANAMEELLGKKSGARGSVVVKALGYKPEGGGF
jgi:RNA 3'-terminal phosphate cyclase